MLWRKRTNVGSDDLSLSPAIQVQADFVKHRRFIAQVYWKDTNTSDKTNTDRDRSYRSLEYVLTFILIENLAYGAFVEYRIG